MSTTTTIRNGLNGTVWYDVVVQEVDPDAVDSTPGFPTGGLSESIVNQIDGEASHYHGIVDLSTLLDLDIEVVSATLYLRRTVLGVQSHDIEVVRNGYIGWDEGQAAGNTSTWNLEDPQTPVCTGTVPLGASFHPVDISTLVADALANRSGILSFIVRHATEAGGDGEGLTIRSANYAADQTQRPYIDVVWDPGSVTEPPADPAAASANTSAASRRIYHDRHRFLLTSHP